MPDPSVIVGDSPVPSTIFDLAVLTALAGVAGALNGGKIGLFKNNVVVTPATILADLTPANFTGYALSGVVVWGTPYLNENGRAEMTAPGKQFTMTDAITPNIIYGYWFQDSTNAYVYAQNFTAPINLGTAGQALIIVPVYPQPPGT